MTAASLRKKSDGEQFSQAMNGRFLQFAQIIFPTSLALVLTFFFTGVVLALVLLLFFVRARMGQDRRMRIALSLALPGMLLDIFSVTFMANVFPNIPPTAHTAFAGCLLWAYSLVLLSALVPLPGTSSFAEE